MSDRRDSKGELPAFGPEAPTLFVIPHSPSTAFVWCSRLDGAAISELRIGGIAAAVLERKKLVRPGHSLEVLFIEGVNLRDGTECELHVTSKARGFVSLQGVSRLARWDDPDTSRVLRLIASRFAGKSGLPLILERYLAFISAWQAPSRVLAIFPEGCIVEIDAVCSGDDIRAYSVAGHGLHPVAMRPLLQRGDRTVLWLTDLTVRHLYLEVSGALIRVNLEDARHAPPTTPGAEGRRLEHGLVEALHGIVAHPSRELGTWAAGVCRPNATIPYEDAVVEILRAVRLPSQELAVFISVAGAPYDPEQFQLEAFAAGRALNVDVIARDRDREGGEYQQQIILTASGLSPEARCHKLSWVYAGRESVVWLRETACGDPRNASLARDFRPVGSVSREIFPTVLHPLATAQPNEAAPRLAQVVEFGPPTASARADVFIFAGPDLEALHRTILGLSLTSRESPIAIHICVFDRGVMDRLVVAAEEWSKIYRVPLTIVGYSERTSEAQVVRKAFRGAVPRIFCRAGVVPRRGDWLSLVLTALGNERTTFLFAAEAGMEPQNAKAATVLPLGGLLSGDGRDLSDRLAAVVVAPDTKPDFAGMPGFYTLEAALLAQALRAGEGEAILPLASAVDFVHSGPQQRPDELYAELDALSLQILCKSFFAARRRPRHRGVRMTG
ncbi:hypothetical protein [Microvirga tunisiensis]|uniref:Uncharacterized protein n=1 Tax=Microvirga tunisiensis TaxID=2108360 RepID=A0A5N7MIP2_9HYPH|nr:hypothetical protein [Microvirga tunisiensis]MPR08700.1 hypothetical protein [Microvirga tunisiensis]MPR26905.1 hypothetical protein [Microvirga tunisiensis]